MGSLKSREQRQNVMLDARLRTAEGWSSVTICNVSPRGLMAKCGAAPPPKGAFVEVCRGANVIVGHVRWSQGVRFGLRTQDRIDIGALVEAPSGRPAGGTERRLRQRRETARARAIPKAVPTEQRSRQAGRLFDWIALAFAGIVGAGIVVSQVHETLSKPLDKVQGALGSPHR